MTADERPLVTEKLLECATAYVAREGGEHALGALRQQLAEIAPNGEPGHLSADELPAILAAIEDVLRRPDCAERFGLSIPELIVGEDELASQIRSARRVTATYQNVPSLVASLDPLASVRLESTGRRSALVWFLDADSPAEAVVAFRRGLLSALPTLMGLPRATVEHASVRPAERGVHGFSVSWRRPPARLEPWVGLFVGSVFSGMVLYGWHTLDPEEIPVALRVVCGLLIAVVGYLYGFRQRQLKDLDRASALVREQNDVLRSRARDLRRSRAALQRSQQRLEQEVQDRGDELKRERQAMDQILGLGHDLSSTLDLEALLDIAVARVPAMLGARLCSVYLIDREGSQLRRAAHNLRDVGSSALSLPISDDEPEEAWAEVASEVRPGELMMRAMRESRSLLVDDVASELGRPRLPHFQTNSCMVILLQSGGSTLGTLNIADRVSGDAFSDTRFHLAKIVGEYLSSAISNAVLLRRTRRMSITDGLTGLYRHRPFQEGLEHEVQSARRYGQPLSLLLLDVDGFKNFNDRWGHPAGDDVLCRVAEELREQLRGSDMAARYGGDEFAAVLPQTPGKGAAALAERVRHGISRLRIERDGALLSVTVSIGVCEYRPAMDRADLIECTDRALYRAKNQGRNRVSLFESEAGAVVDAPVLANDTGLPRCG